MLYYFIKTKNTIYNLKSGTLSLQLSELVPVLAQSIVTARPTIASSPSKTLNLSLVVPHIRLLITIIVHLSIIFSYF